MKMNRRDAVKMMSLSTAAIAAAPWSAFGSPTPSRMESALSYPYTLPDLPYPVDALEAFIDAETMTLHHTKHHATYVTQLNKALAEQPDWQSSTLIELLENIERLPSTIRTAVRNHGGGHANHSLFWQILQADESILPDGALSDAINAAFGDFDRMINELRQASLSVFGSGWAWLTWTPDGLAIETTPNQDSPWMQGRQPLVGIDVWEHAYYLRYQNRRAEYVHALTGHINWSVVAGLLPI